MSYKMKTKKAASKRFRVTSSGRIKRASANKEHILTKKSRSRKNRLKKGGEVHPHDRPLIKACLPHS